MSAPGIAWVNSATLSPPEIRDIHRFDSPKKLCGYTGLCPGFINQGTPTDAAR